jgi:hypothetical protein
MLCAVGHFIFFRAIDGLPVGLTLRQSYATYISLLFATGFRAFLVGSATTSFTQYLWRFLRQNPIRISLIEQLFQLRHSLLVLLHPRVIWNAPIPFFVALLLWVAPIAMIYPPGALTVVSRPHSFIRSYNMSVVNPDLSDNLYTVATLDTYPSLYEKRVWTVFWPNTGRNATTY